MSTAIERLKKAALKEPSGWIEDAKWRRTNKIWLKKSSKIAIRVLREIRAQKPINGMTQKKLAIEMGVTPQYVSKLVKGQENLTLETIAKMEQVLGVSLIDITENANRREYIAEKADISASLSPFQSKNISQTTVAYQPNSYLISMETYGETA